METLPIEGSEDPGTRSIRELLSDTLHAVRETWRTAILLIFVLVGLPSLLLIGGVLLLVSRNWVGGLLVVIGIPIVICGAVLCSIGLCEFVWAWLGGEDLDFEQIVKVATKHFWYYVAAVLIYCAFLMVPSMVLSVVGAFGGPILYVIVMLIQQVGGIYIGIRMISLLPIVVFEDLNPWDSIQRAWSFTASPYTGFVAKRYLSLVGIFMSLILVLILLLILFFATFGKGLFAFSATSPAPPAWFLVMFGAFALLVGIPFMIYTMYFNVLLYIDIRREREEEDMMGGQDITDDSTNALPLTQ
jgi:hypothetical protein